MPRKSQPRKSRIKRPSGAQAKKTNPTAPATHKPWQIAAVCLVLAVATVLSFRSVRNSDFVILDDYGYVLQNQAVQQGVTMQSVVWAFTTFHCSNWHPLTWISHTVDWRLYGESPGGHHMTNVCLHTANAILLFLLLLYMTGYLGRSAIVAFLFALHPAHVESVAWVSERKDVLCAFFYFSTLLAYAWYMRRPSWRRFALVVCAFACALLSKPMAVTLPFALLLLDYWPLRGITFAPEARARWFSSFWKLCVEKWLLFIMAAISCVITYMAQKASGAVGSLRVYPMWERLCNAAISYCLYMRIMFWPDPLRVCYRHELNNITVSAAALSAFALILVTAVCWRMRGQKPYCLIGWLWFLGTLIPVIGLVQVGEQAMAERYTYLPYIGLFIAIVWLAGDAVAKFPKIKAAAQLLAVAVIAACAVKTYAQVKVWKDSVTLYSHVTEIYPHWEDPHSALGMAYARQGLTEEALKELRYSLAIQPNQAVAHSEIGKILAVKNQLPEAVEEFTQAVRLDPANASMHNDFGVVLFRVGDYEKSAEQFSDALRIEPASDYARRNLGLAQAAMKNNKGENRGK